MEKTYKIINGERPVMLSAPHCETHYRNGSRKSAERKTKEILMYLCKKTGCHGIYALPGQNNIDANYHDTPYKTDLISYIKNNRIMYLFDLHQMAKVGASGEVRKESVCIGTGGSNNKNILGDSTFLNYFIKSLNNSDISTIVNGYNFGATMSYTISASVAAACKIRCLQLEINSGFIKRKSNLRKLKKALRKTIRSL